MATRWASTEESLWSGPILRVTTNAEFELEIDRRVEKTIKADLEPALDRRQVMTKAEYRWVLDRRLAAQPAEFRIRYEMIK
jgi:hypothetical protein